MGLVVAADTAEVYLQTWRALAGSPGWFDAVQDRYRYTFLRLERLMYDVRTKHVVREGEEFTKERGKLENLKH